MSPYLPDCYRPRRRSFWDWLFGWRERRWHQRLERAADDERWRIIQARNDAIRDIIRLRREGEQALREASTVDYIDGTAIEEYEE